MIHKVFNLLRTTAVSQFKRKGVDYSTWIFSSSFNTKYNYNSKYLFEYVLKNEPGITPLYVINDDTLREKLKGQIGNKYFIETKSWKGINKVLNAGVWFTSAGLPVYGLGLNKQRMIINLWHGVPLKKIALMENSLDWWTSLYFKHIFSNNYTHILTTSENLVSTMQKSFGVPRETIKVWGQPRNDALFSQNSREKVLNEIYGQLPAYNKVVLYAPTFRENRGTKFFPFEDFTSTKLENFLEEQKLLIFIRCHQSEMGSTANKFGDRVKLINADRVEEIMDIINIFDLLITDYSSIFIDYLLTQKPVLFLPYDKEQYIGDRGFNFDYDSITPGPKPATFDSFQQEVIRLLENQLYYQAERQNANSFFNHIQEECSPEICTRIKEIVGMKQSKKE